MTGSAMSIHNGHSRTVDSEELQQIRGIGATKKQWLETLGICSIQDLAIASVQDIKSRLKQLGYVASRSEIDFWIAQACQIASSQPGAIAAGKDEESPPNNPTPLLSEAVDWQTTTSLSVDFQTRSNPDHQETRVVLRHPETNTVYTAILPEMTFSLPGLYRLKVVATLLDLPCTEGSFKVPVLTVA